MVIARRISFRRSSSKSLTEEEKHAAAAAAAAFGSPSADDETAPIPSSHWNPRLSLRPKILQQSFRARRMSHKSKVRVVVGETTAGTVFIKLSEPLAKARSRISHELKPALERLASTSFSFLLAGEEGKSSNQVSLDSEDSTLAKDCVTSDGCLRIHPGKRRRRSTSMLTDSKRLQDLLPEAASVRIRCDLLADRFESDRTTSTLPSHANTALEFVIDVSDLAGNAEIGTTLGNTVPWARVEAALGDVEDCLRTIVRRDKLSGWWYSKTDQMELTAAIAAVQKELKQGNHQWGNGIPEASSLFEVMFEKPDDEAEWLLEKMGNLTLSNLREPQHATLRETICSYLGLVESELLFLLQRLGESSLHMSQKEMVLECTLLLSEKRRGSAAASALTAGEDLEQCLAPLLYLDDTLIDNRVRSFADGTRSWAFESFDNFVTDRCRKHRLYILAAGSGAGKTSIASKIARDRDDVVIAYHFCRHDDARWSRAKAMMLSVAYQIGRRFPPYLARLERLVKDLNLTNAKLQSDQFTLATIFTEFLEIPLHDLKMNPNRKHVIVIDGIDECAAPAGKPRRNEILDAIRRYFTRVPPWVHVYITTRPVLSVLKKLKKFNAKMVEPMEHQNVNDMRTFATNLLFHQGLFDGDPNGAAATTEALVQNCDGSVLYVSIVADMLERSKGRHEDAMDVLRFLPLRTAGLFQQQLDQIQGSLSSASSGPEPLALQVVKLCIAAVEPLHLDLLIALTGSESDELNKAINEATAFFTVRDSRVRFRHKSVKDWIIKECRNTPANESKNNRDSTSKHTMCSPSSLFTGSSSYGISGEALADEMAKYHSYFASKCLALIDEGGILVDRSSCNQTSACNVTCDDESKCYVLRHGISHLQLGGMASAARNLLLDPGWLMARSDDGAGIIDDCESFGEGDQTIQLLQRAFKSALPALQSDTRQLPGQLVGRLHVSALEGIGDAAVHREISDFLQRVKERNYGFDWLCPVSATWDQAEQAFLRRMVGHSDTVQTVAWNKDGRRVASGSWDRTVRVFDTVTGQVEKELKGHKDSVWSVAWSPSGDRLASGSLDGTVMLWKWEANAESWDCEMILKAHLDQVFAVAWSHDGRYVVSGSKDSNIRIWSAIPTEEYPFGECKQLLAGHSGWVYSVACEPGGDKIVSGSTDMTVRIWSLQQKCGRFECTQTLKGHTDWVRSVSWSNNGRSQVLSGGADGTIRIWDSNNGECIQVLTGHTDSVWSVSSSKDGRWVVSGGTDHSVRIWSASSGRCEQVLDGHKGPIWSVAWSTDGKRMVSGSTDMSLILWEDTLSRESEAAFTGHSASVWSLDLSMDGTILASGSADKTVRLWETLNGTCTRVLVGHSGPIWAVALSKDAQRIASGSTDNTASIYRVATGERQLVLSGHTNSVWCVIWSVDGSQVFTGSRDKSIRVWDSFLGETDNILSGHDGDVRSLALTKNGSRLASGSSDKSIRIWNTETFDCERVVRVGNAGVLSVAWSPDGQHLASGLADKNIKVHSCLGECEQTLTGHDRRVNSVAWSPDGDKIVSVSTDKTVRVWQVKNASKCLLVLSGHTGLGVYSVTWSQDGKRLVSGGTDKTVRIWEARSPGRCEAVLTGHTGLGIYTVAWSEDGCRVASGSRDRTIQIWNTDNGSCEQFLTGHTNWIHSVQWEKGGKHIASIADDDTVRIWDVEKKECTRIIESARNIPSDFVAASTSCITQDLSGKSPEGEPVGIQFEKVQIFGDRACSWAGQSVIFFKLVRAP